MSSSSYKEYTTKQPSSASSSQDLYDQATQQNALALDNQLQILNRKLVKLSKLNLLLELPGIQPVEENVAHLLMVQCRELFRHEDICKIFSEALECIVSQRAFRAWFVEWTSGVIGSTARGRPLLFASTLIGVFLLMMRCFRATPRVVAVAKQLTQWAPSTTVLVGHDDFGSTKSAGGSLWSKANELFDALAEDPFIKAHPPPTDNDVE